jgi:hypothetical protein
LLKGPAGRGIQTDHANVTRVGLRAPDRCTYESPSLLAGSGRRYSDAQRPLSRGPIKELEHYMTDLKTSEPQRLRALERANEIRLARAVIKRRIALGEVSAAEVILQCPEAADSWTVSELLMSQRRWGSTRCRKFLSRNRIVETKPVGKLTDRQRQLLASSLQQPSNSRDMELVA